MMTNITQIIGLVAAGLTTFAFLPQTIKTWKTKSTDDLSLPMFICLFVGIILWFSYGVILNNLPIILANSLTICMTTIILYFLIKGNKKSSIEHVAIWVENLEEMKNFYCINFNGYSNNRYYNPETNFSSYFISYKSGPRIELMNKPGYKASASKQFSGHISFSLGSKKMVDEKTEFFRKLNIKIIGQPRTTGDGYYESIIADPEGNLIELTI